MPDRSVPFGKYWRSSPLVFSLIRAARVTAGRRSRPRCRWRCGPASSPASPRPDPRSASGAAARAASGSSRPARGRPARACTRRAAAPASCSRWCVRRACRSRRRCAVPMIRSPSQCPGTARSIGLGRAFADVDHVGDPVLALTGLAARDPQRPARTQTTRQLPFQRAARLHVQRLVDRLGRHPHLRLVGEILAQPSGDLLRRVPLGQLGLHPLAQHQVGRQLRRLRSTGPLVGEHVR